MAFDLGQMWQTFTQQVDAQLIAGRFDNVGSGLQEIQMNRFQTFRSIFWRQRSGAPQTIADLHDARDLQLRSEASVQ